MDLRCCGVGGPHDVSRQEVDEAGLFGHGLGELRLHEWERARCGAAEDVDRGGDEELERDHRGNGVSGEAEDRGILAAGKNYGLAGPDRDGVEQKLGTE